VVFKNYYFYAYSNLGPAWARLRMTTWERGTNSGQDYLSEFKRLMTSFAVLDADQDDVISAEDFVALDQVMFTPQLYYSTTFVVIFKYSLISTP
jgi:hypothetical protein